MSITYASYVCVVATIFEAKNLDPKPCTSALSEGVSWICCHNSSQWTACAVRDSDTNSRSLYIDSVVPLVFARGGLGVVGCCAVALRDCLGRALGGPWLRGEAAWHSLCSARGSPRGECDALGRRVRPCCVQCVTPRVGSETE